MSERPMSLTKSLTLLFCCAGLLLVTVPKLYKMFVIKGWVSGGIVCKAVVTRKEPPRFDNYDIRWKFVPDVKLNELDPDALRSDGRSRVNRGEYERVQVGEEIEIVAVRAFLNDEPYLVYRNSIFVEPGNFAFDVVLLVGELLGIAFAGRSLYLLRRDGI